MKTRVLLGFLAALWLSPASARDLVLPLPHYNDSTGQLYFPGGLTFAPSATTDATNALNVLGTPAGATQQSLQSIINRTIYVNGFAGVDPTGATDSTTGIQAALNQAAIAAMPTEVHFGAGNYCFSTLGTALNGLTISGMGGKTILCQTSAAANGLTIGYPGTTGYVGATITSGVTVRDLTFDTKSGVTKTGGSMLLAYYVSNFTLRNVHVGTKALDVSNPIHHSYNGITIAGFLQATLDNVEIQNAAYDGLTVYALPNTPQSSPTTDYGSELHVTGGSQFNVFGHFGIHVGGGAGGVYFESGGQANATSYGAYLDATLDPLGHPNPQVVFGPGFAVDSNGADGIYAANNAVGDLFCRGCWSSSNVGAGLNTGVTQTNGNTFIVSGGHFENNGGAGLIAGGGSWTIGGASDFHGNGTASPGNSGIQLGTGIVNAYLSDFSSTGNGAGGAGYGVDDFSPAGTTILGPAQLTSNQSGATRSANGFGIMAVASPVSLRSTLNVTGAATLQSTLNVTGAYSANGTVGLTCAGTPTSSFASVNGIVTHC